MSTRITIFTALILLAGNASADFFDGFDMGNFFGNNRQQQAQQANAFGQTYGNGNSSANGQSRGRGEADINMDFDLNFRAKANSMFNADSVAQGQGDVAQYQDRQLNAYGSTYNTAYNGLNTGAYSYPSAYYPYNYYTPYPSYYYPQAYYPQAQGYYLPPAQ
ncbi:MAG: hypothetical protein BWK73_32420 [Thiothrix lacustris]|uniref:Sulfur globule protein CV1 n=1 Tax=Thiothrix lacustris TaxID=525917 RepID=A0A1Y1QI16_9GAMM|nr:MAG: hypothetical protein BWK73_32420 [Thiothrix lacustris]